jgi:TolB-like protein/DNA-binding SARP family transcriptional activator
VTEPSTKPHPTDRHRLRTLGTFALVGPRDDTILGTRGHQRRRLALLAVLAAAGERGRSRDQLLLLFWPDVSQSRARHSLEQLLYEIRSAVGGAAFVGVNPVCLAPAIVSSDVADFNDALERGDLEVAVEAYRGPFLDGFHLGDAPEFEQWLGAERARLERGYASALERLAQSAEAAHDPTEAARWWRKLTDIDPVSSANAAGLIRALMNAGDHAAALQHAERYEAVVAQELGTSVGPAVANLVAEVRASAKSQPVAGFKPPPPVSPPRAYVAPLTVTPAPIEPTPIEPMQPPRASQRRPALYALIALLVLIGAALSFRAVLRGRTLPSPRDASIAVLPFANVSGDREDAVLVDALSEELIAVLAQIPKLRVIARTSSFAFRNSDAGVRRIADSLGVSYLLEGGVQKIASRLRVQVRLVDARDGSTRWSEIYDRNLGDIFVVQSEIASIIARELDLRLSESTLARVKRGATRNIAAYELYLRGNDPTLLRSDSGARHALEYFRQAIALDSNYAAAYTGLARLQMVVGAGGDPTLSRRELIARAEQSALKAVALDDSLADAHAALSLIRRGNYDFASAETEMKRAIALDTADARILGWLVQLDVATERPAEALVAARRALALDPLSAAVNAELARAFLANGRCDEALAQLEKLRSLRQPLLRARSIAAQCYARKQMWPEAIGEMQHMPAAGRGGQALLGYMLARGGRTSEARRILAGLLDRSSKMHGDSFEIATVYAGLGENEQAFAWLDKAVDDRSLGFDHFALIMDTLPHDARLDRLRQRLGLQKG